MRQWNPEQFIIDYIIKEYNCGLSARQLGFKYHVSTITIINLLKRNNIAIRNFRK